MNEEVNELILDVREQVRYLSELGVQSMGVHLADAPIESPRSIHPAAATSIRENKLSKAEPAAAKPRETSRLASLPSLAKRKPMFPEAVEPSVIEQKEMNERPVVATTSMAAVETEAMTVELKADTDATVAVHQVITPAESNLPETIQDIRIDIGDCLRCPLHIGRTQVVHSTGNLHAELMFVGEAPGANEDEEGVPFVGRAGKLLTQIIEAIQLKREDVFIGNINRCRPPGNRAPEPAEAAVCKPFLLREIAVIRPKVIVVLGATAAQNLLETKVPISKLRGQFHDHLGTKVMPTFHPAYLLRDPHKKREVWEDMKMVRDYLRSSS